MTDYPYTLVAEPLVPVADAVAAFARLGGSAVYTSAPYEHLRVEGSVRAPSPTAALREVSALASDERFAVQVSILLGEGRDGDYSFPPLTRYALARD